MNKNVLIVLAGGFLIAILVAVLVQASLGSKKKEAKDSTNIEILVAARDLAMGKELVAGDLKWQAWPANAVFAGAIQRQGQQAAAEAATGRMLQALSAGQPLHPAMIVGEGAGSNFLAVSLKEGMRAVAISVKAQTMAGGFVGPGDRVDVIVTYKVKIKDKNNMAVKAMIDQYASETVLENVRVMAADQKAIRQEDKAKVARTVTLEVTAEQAEKLTLASELGDLKLALRGIGDEEVTRSKEITTDVEVSRVLKSLSRAQASSGGSSDMVRVYNGQNITNMPVRPVYQE
jgi:pilus assembly protein CpaB